MQSAEGVSRASRLPRYRVRWNGEPMVAWAFLAPALLLLVLLAVYPLGYALYLSMTTAQIGVPGRFVGAANFIRLARTEIFSLTLWNTVWYTAVAVFAVVLVNVWAGLPFFGITFLAGLVTIPRELYEAATVDGVGALGQFRRLTLPLLRPVLATVVLFSVVMTSSDFATIFVLTRGGPMNTTQVLATLAYRLGLATGDLGTGAAISLYLFPILIAVTAIQARLMRRSWQWQGRRRG